MMNIEIYIRAFNYLLDKYGYKLKILKPKLIKRLKECKNEKECERIINNKENYIYLINDKNLEDIDALIFVLMNSWEYNSDAKKDLKNLLFDLKII